MYFKAAKIQQHAVSSIRLKDLVSPHYQELTPDERREHLKAVLFCLRDELKHSKREKTTLEVGYKIHIVNEELKDLKTVCRKPLPPKEYSLHFVDAARELLAPKTFSAITEKAKLYKLQYENYAFNKKEK